LKWSFDMGLKNMLRRWLEIPEAPQKSVEVYEPDGSDAPIRSDPKISDALAIAGVMHSAPVPPRHAPRSIPKRDPKIACIVDPNDPNALLGAFK
jgi:hypothetical protein